MRHDALAMLAARDRASNARCRHGARGGRGEGRVGPPDPFLAAHDDAERVVWNTVTVAPRQRTWSGPRPPAPRGLLTPAAAAALRDTVSRSGETARPWPHPSPD